MTPECPRCAYARVRHKVTRFFEELADAEKPGSWGAYLYASETLFVAATLLGDHAEDNAKGPLCHRHERQAGEMDRELARDCEREHRAH